MNFQYTATVPPVLSHGEIRDYLVKLLQAVLGFDTGLLNIIINSIKDCALW